MAAAVGNQGRRELPNLSSIIPHLPLLLCVLIFAAPTFLRLGQQVWSKEIGAHGPIVLATGIWLMWRTMPQMLAEGVRGRPAITFAATLVSLPIYIFGRAYDFISLEALGVYGFGCALLYDRVGLRAMVRSWFPIFYLALLLPAPGWLLDQITAPLKLLVSALAAGIVEPFGLPIWREGVTMIVGPYQLLVEDACSGMNSLIGLIAITLFYIYLLRDAGVRYAAFLVCLIIPVAIIANIIRIVVLILLTYFFGDAVGQGFLHATAGLFLFALSLILMFFIDSVASRFMRTTRKGPQ